MAWTNFQDCTGQTWAVERDALCGLIRANVRAVAIRKRARTVIESHTFSADLHTVEVDWNGLDDQVNRETQEWWKETEARLKHLPAQWVFNEISILREETLSKTAEFQYMQKEASRITARNITGSVETWDWMITGAELTRDLSATFVMTGCTVLSGGAAAAAAGAVGGVSATSAGAITGMLAVGSTLKGVAKYQDTGRDGVKFEGRIGSALVEGVGSFGLGLVGLGTARAGMDGKFLLVVTSAVDGGLEGGKALIEGSSGREALVKAGTKMAQGVAMGMLGNKAESWLKTLPLNTNVSIQTLANFGSDKITGWAADRSNAVIDNWSSSKEPTKLGAVPQASGVLNFAPAVKGPVSAINAHDEYVRQAVLRRAA